MQGLRAEIIGIAAGLAVVLAASLADAREVYVNGVNVGSLRNQTFKDATVTIDENGDIRIDAPRYEIDVVDEKDRVMGTANGSDDQTGRNPQLQKRYFLAAQPADGGRAQYDIVIKINGIERRVVKAGDPEVIVEVSAWLKAGHNTVEIAARKNLAGGRKSTSPSDSVRVVVGPGHEEGKIVKIDGVSADFKCDASQLADVVKTYEINAN
jgi:hypothetical protein